MRRRMGLGLVSSSGRNPRRPLSHGLGLLGEGNSRLHALYHQALYEVGGFRTGRGTSVQDDKIIIIIIIIRSNNNSHHSLCNLSVERSRRIGLTRIGQGKGISYPQLLQRLFFILFYFILFYFILFYFILFFAGTKAGSAGMQAPHLTIGSIAFYTVPLPPLSALPETPRLLASTQSYTVASLAFVPNHIPRLTIPASCSSCKARRLPVNPQSSILTVGEYIFRTTPMRHRWRFPYL